MQSREEVVWGGHGWTGHWRRGVQTPVATKKPRMVDGPIHLISFPVCGGLHHRYERVAA
ncbi:hypothetical protein MYX65_10490 [Acidobacteria bacterium AH-259-L09]|nr:hypothetical protein [Acidobacteria bacterium AH-259-L09]